MNTNQLAPIFLDDQPVSLQDERPKVSAILAAVGKPGETQVKWLRSTTDTQGRALRSEEVVDRTAKPGQPIYLTSARSGAQPAKADAADAADRGSGADAARAEGASRKEDTTEAAGSGTEWTGSRTEQPAMAEGAEKGAGSAKDDETSGEDAPSRAA